MLLLLLLPPPLLLLLWARLLRSAAVRQAGRFERGAAWLVAPASCWALCCALASPNPPGRACAG